ncbi:MULTISPECIES: uroporphyrinogen decarboxylase [unclassified Beijerinckia]|uniref:uroporphyrinogen decarboxylase n=1 Tax=unclassified Beijerinckia TaxID=2638183 RepID=UPI000B898E58|nr:MULTISPECIES: uroporphyrinogen decarboxylase [unclassified Beijerinckia]
MSKPVFLSVLDGQAFAQPPIWMMRQAGRYLPEYLEIRAKTKSFLEFCYNSELAIEATLQPIRRFGFDAAIIFSDILVIPDALGQDVRFEVGEGPRLAAIEAPDGLKRLSTTLDMDHLAPVYRAITGVRAQLPADVALVGFCGAPWTLATYMIGGRGTPDQAPARLFAYRYPAAFAQLIDLLVEVAIVHLSAQIEAGANAVQIFDSWAGSLPTGELKQWSVRPIRRIAEGVKARHPGAKVIGFPRAVGEQLTRFTEIGALDALSIDTTADRRWARQAAGGKPLQGNLDPLALLAGGSALDQAIDCILEDFAGYPHVFNLGHGILPPTPIKNVEHLIGRVRSGRRR